MSNEFFRFKQFLVRQERCAMKVGTDGTLLGAWAGVPASASPQILDIGTGTGLIALMMAQRFPEARINGVDIDEEAAAQAAENVSESPFADRVAIRRAAIQDVGSECVYDAIVCNPPYFIDSLKCPDEQRSIARHNSALTYSELASHAYRLLKADGEFSVIIPTECVPDMASAASIAGLMPRRICHVKTTPAKQAKRVLLSFGKMIADNIVSEELIIGSDTYNGMLRDFYLRL